MRKTSFVAKVRLTGIFLFVAGIAVLAFSNAARAQDTFEIRVEQYEQPALGQFSLEEHLNDVGIGTTHFDGTVAPTSHQFHMSSELTAGLKDYFSLGGMIMTAAIPGDGGLEYAGWRVLPHFYAPDSWHSPIQLGFTVEFSFQRASFDESTATLELRPILERSIGRLQLDLNPAIERALSHADARNGWNFEPSLRIAYNAHGRFRPTFEYFGAQGKLKNIRPLDQQVHQIYPGCDWKATKNIDWNFGVGIGLTPAGNRLVYKTILEVSFGRTTKVRGNVSQTKSEGRRWSEDN